MSSRRRRPERGVLSSASLWGPTETGRRRAFVGGRACARTAAARFDRASAKRSTEVRVAGADARSSRSPRCGDRRWGRDRRGELLRAPRDGKAVTTTLNTTTPCGETSRDLNTSAKTAADISTGAFAVGLVGIGFAAYFWLFDKPPTTTGTLRWTPTIGRGHGTIDLEGTVLASHF